MGPFISELISPLIYLGEGDFESILYRLLYCPIVVFLSDFDRKTLSISFYESSI